MYSIFCWVIEFISWVLTSVGMNENKCKCEGCEHKMDDPSSSLLINASTVCADEKSSLSRQCASNWWKMKLSDRKAHYDLMRIQLLSPFLFSKVYQDDAWVEWAKKAGLISQKRIQALDDLSDEELENTDLMELAIIKLQEKIINHNKSNAPITKFLEEILDDIHSLSGSIKADQFDAVINKVNDKNWFKSVRMQLPEETIIVNRTKLDYVVFLVAWQVSFYVKHVYKEKPLDEYKKESSLDAALEVHKQRGNAYFKNEEYGKAIGKYTTILQKKPYLFIIYGNRAQCFLKQQQYRSALSDGRRAIALDPSWDKGQYRYAKAMYELKRYKETLSALSKAIKICSTKQQLLALQRVVRNTMANPDSHVVYFDSMEKNSVNCKNDVPSTNEEDIYADMPELEIDISDVSDNEEQELMDSVEAEEANKGAIVKSENKPADKVMVVIKDQITKELPFTHSEISMTVFALIEEGTTCLLNGTLNLAVRTYLNAFQIILKQPNNLLSDMEMASFRYSFGWALQETGGSLELNEALYHFGSIKKKFPSMNFPLSSYGAAVVYHKLNRFTECLNELQEALRISTMPDSILPCCWARVDTIIDISIPEKFQDAVENLKNRSLNAPKPDALCRYMQCKQSVTTIYFTDPGFEGFVRLTCSQDCHVEFHFVCWQQYKIEQMNATKEKDFFKLPCFMPNCFGIFWYIQIYSESMDAREIKPKLAIQNPTIQKKSLREFYSALLPRSNLDINAKKQNPSQSQLKDKEKADNSAEDIRPCEITDEDRETEFQRMLLEESELSGVKKDEKYWDDQAEIASVYTYIEAILKAKGCVNLSESPLMVKMWDNFLDKNKTQLILKFGSLRNFLMACPKFSFSPTNKNIVFFTKNSDDYLEGDGRLFVKKASCKSSTKMQPIKETCLNADEDNEELDFSWLYPPHPNLMRNKTIQKHVERKAKDFIANEGNAISEPVVEDITKGENDASEYIAETTNDLPKRKKTWTAEKNVSFNKIDADKSELSMEESYMKHGDFGEVVIKNTGKKMKDCMDPNPCKILKDCAEIKLNNASNMVKEDQHKEGEDCVNIKQEDLNPVVVEDIDKTQDHVEVKHTNIGDLIIDDLYNGKLDCIDIKHDDLSGIIVEGVFHETQDNIEIKNNGINEAAIEEYPKELRDCIEMNHNAINEVILRDLCKIKDSEGKDAVVEDLFNEITVFRNCNYVEKYGISESRTIIEKKIATCDENEGYLKHISNCGTNTILSYSDGITDTVIYEKHHHCPFSGKCFSCAELEGFEGELSKNIGFVQLTNIEHEEGNSGEDHVDDRNEVLEDMLQIVDDNMQRCPRFEPLCVVEVGIQCDLDNWQDERKNLKKLNFDLIERLKGLQTVKDDECKGYKDLIQKQQLDIEKLKDQLMEVDQLREEIKSGEDKCKQLLDQIHALEQINIEQASKLEKHKDEQESYKHLLDAFHALEQDSAQKAKKLEKHKDHEEKYRRLLDEFAGLKQVNVEQKKKLSKNETLQQTMNDKNKALNTQMEVLNGQKEALTVSFNEKIKELQHTIREKDEALSKKNEAFHRIINEKDMKEIEYKNRIKMKEEELEKWHVNVGEMKSQHEQEKHVQEEIISRLSSNFTEQCKRTQKVQVAFLEVKKEIVSVKYQQQAAVIQNTINQMQFWPCVPEVQNIRSIWDEFKNHFQSCYEKMHEEFAKVIQLVKDGQPLEDLPPAKYAEPPPFPKTPMANNVPFPSTPYCGAPMQSQTPLLSSDPIQKITSSTLASSFSQFSQQNQQTNFPATQSVKKSIGTSDLQDNASVALNREGSEDIDVSENIISSLDSKLTDFASNDLRGVSDISNKTNLSNHSAARNLSNPNPARPNSSDHTPTKSNNTTKSITSKSSYKTITAKVFNPPAKTPIATSPDSKLSFASSVKKKAVEQPAVLKAAPNMSTAYSVGSDEMYKSDDHRNKMFDRIIVRLGSIFPNFSREELRNFVYEYRRMQPQGSLSGIKFDDLFHNLEKMIRGMITNGKQPPMNSPTSFAKKNVLEGNQKKMSVDNSSGLPGSGRRRRANHAPNTAGQWCDTASKSTKHDGFGEEEPCVICYEDMSKETLVKLNCGHIFHRGCISCWLKEQRTCPICRVHALLPDEYPSLH